MRFQRQECPRCCGMMVETYADVASPDDAGRDVFGQRCVNCGEYVDQQILQNRGTQERISPLHLQLMGRGLSPRRSLPRSISHRHAGA